MPKKALWGIIGAVTVCVTVPVLGQATQTTPVVKKEPAPYVTPSSGAVMFHEYCSPCHGVSGRGDGPAAPALNPKPADLTSFAKRREGKFAAKDFEDKLTGALMVRGHGNSEMPVWGPIFSQLGNQQLRMANLAKYVESIQVK